MKRKLFLLLLVGFTMICSIEVDAHPGRTDSNGCHTCRTNCAKWGLSNGQYHCHNGGTSSSSSPSTSSSSSNSSSNKNNSTTSAPKAKSKDNTIKSILINGENIKVSDTMEYKTFDEKVDISVETNDKNATYEVDNRDLNVGVNDLSISVKAEDGTVKKYRLLIERESLSNNTNISIYVNEKIIEFENDKAVIILEENEDFNYRYVLEDAKSKVSVSETSNDGEDVIIFKVTAEDGTLHTYELSIIKDNKEESSEEKNNGGVAAGIVALVSIGGGIYYLKRKNK